MRGVGVGGLEGWGSAVDLAEQVSDEGKAAWSSAGAQGAEWSGGTEGRSFCVSRSVTSKRSGTPSLYLSLRPPPPLCLF